MSTVKEKSAPDKAPTNGTARPSASLVATDEAHERLRRGHVLVQAGADRFDLVAPGEAQDAAEALNRTFMRTDLGNAERLVARHGRDLRYCQALGWFVWDGGRWAPDETGEVERRAKQTVRAIYDEASRATDPDERAALAKHAGKSEAAGRIHAMIELARSDSKIAVRANELDAHAFLFTCANGTIDLRTGESRPHRRADLITKMSPVHYDADARSELWERVLHDATGDHEGLQAFLQRAAGYSLTGDTGEEVLFFAHGPAATSKSTFVEALKSALGDYAMTADFESFTTGRRSGGPKNDIARLAGGRFVASIEVDDGAALAEGLITQLTGGDKVQARFLYKEGFEFKPAFKLWLVANYAPKVSDRATAMWRRILKLPFTHVVPKDKRDPAVKRELLDPVISGPAILAWAVRGCLEWRKKGLGVPPSVEKATEEYRTSQDPLVDFFTERCVFERGASITRERLRTAYDNWARRNKVFQPLSPKEFTARIREREGVTEGKVRDSLKGGLPRDGWKGIRVAT